MTSVVTKADSWETSLTAVGTLNAVQGVTVGAELVGKVVKIAFEPGTPVKKGDILLRQDTSSEEAQLPGAVAQADLSRTNLERSEQLFKKGIIARADLDNAVAIATQAQAQVENIRATISNKTIRAPFSGQLGIRLVNLGQILPEGDPIVTLQSLDPIYIDFALPQQQFPLIRLGLPVRVTGDAARNSIGLMLVGGLFVGTLFTLFVVPSIYMLIARDHTKDREREAKITAETPG